MGNKTILCVDDEPSIRDTIVMILERGGYNIHCTGDPDDAFDAYCAARPFLVLMDLVLENDTSTNGIILADRMRLYHGACVFTALTGNIARYDFGRLRQVFDEILLKPVRATQLYDVAKTSLEKSLRWDEYLR